MSFPLLLLVTAILFIRPTDFFAGLGSLYLVAIAACLFSACNGVARQFSTATMVRQPITVGNFGILGAMVLSIIGNLDLNFTQAVEFAKVILYYLLLVTVLDSTDKLNKFVRWVPIFLCVPIGLAVLNHQGYISHRAFEPPLLDPVTGELYYPNDGRLRGSGMFADPNDLCLLISVGIAFSLYGLLSRGVWLARICWIGPIIVFVLALKLTESRGGLLSAMSSLAMLFLARFGIRKGLLVGLVCLPLIISQFGGRQIDFGVSDQHHTGQYRIQFWSNAMELFKSSILFGVGPERSVNYITRSIHNSFVQIFSDLGLIGATFFVGAFFQAYQGLFRLDRSPDLATNSELRTLRPYLLAALTGYGVMMMSTNHTFHVSSFAMLGMAAAFNNLADVHRSSPDAMFNGRLFFKWLMVTLVYLFGTISYIKLNLNY